MTQCFFHPYNYITVVVDAKINILIEMSKKGIKAFLEFSHPSLVSQKLGFLEGKVLMIDKKCQTKLNHEI